MISLSFLIPIFLKHGGSIIKQLKSSGKVRDVHAGNIIDKQKEQIERLVQAKVYIEHNQIPNLPPEFTLLFMMFLNEAQRTAESTMRDAAALADEDIDIQPLIDEARAEIIARIYPKEDVV